MENPFLKERPNPLKGLMQPVDPAPAGTDEALRQPQLNTPFSVNLPFFDPSGPDALGLAMKFNFFGTAADHGGLLYDLSQIVAQPGYDPFADKQLEGHEANMDFFAESRSRAETAKRLEWLERRRVEQDTLAATGLPGIVAPFAAAALDPSNFVLPGFAEAGVARNLLGTVAAVGIEQGLQSAMDPDYRAADAVTAALTAGAFSAGIAATTRWVNRDGFSRATRGLLDGEQRPRGGDGEPVSGRTGMSAEGEAAEQRLDRLDEFYRRTGAAPELADMAAIDKGEAPAARPAGEGAAAEGSTVGAAQANALPSHEQMVLDEGLARSGIGLETVGYNPILRLLNQPLLAAREVVSRLADLGGMVQNKNRRGVATGTSVPVNFRAKWLAPLADALDATDRAFLEMRGKAAGAAPHFQTLGVMLRDTLGGGRGQMTAAEFRSRVGQAMRNGDRDIAGNAFVERAAQAWRTKLVEPLKQAGIESGLFEYPIREEIRRLDTQIAAARDVAAKAELSRQRDNAQMRLDALTQNGPELLKDTSYFPVMIRHDIAQADRAGFEGVIADYLHSTGADPATVRDTTKRIAESYLQDRPYVRFDPDDTPVASGARERAFDIPSNYVASNGRRWDDFLENDVEVVLRHHARTMGMGVEMMNQFGELSLRSVLDDIMAEGKQAFQGATTAADRARIQKETALAMSDVRGLRDLVLGSYGLPDDPYRPLSRGIRVAKAWNYLALLGGAAVGAIPDVGRIMMKEGLERGFKAPLAAFMADRAGFQMAVKEARLAGQALELVMNARAVSFMDVGDVFGNRAKWERALYGSTGIFSTFGNLLAPWNQVMKSWAGAVVSSRIAEDAIKWADEGAVAVRPTVSMAEARTGQPWRGQMVRGSGGGKVNFDNAALGEGTYWTSDPKLAKMYGKEIEQATVELKNPYVINNDAQLKTLFGGTVLDDIKEIYLGLTKQWAEGKEAYLSRQLSLGEWRQKQKDIEAQLSQHVQTALDARAAQGDAMKRIREAGHDGIVVSFGADTADKAKWNTGGFERAAERLASGEVPDDLYHMARLFSHDQVVAFGPNGGRAVDPPMRPQLGEHQKVSLAKSGIDKEMATRIRNEMALHGELRGDLHIANSEEWTDLGALDAYRRAIQTDVDRVIVTPGEGEQPLFASTELGSLIFQFKRFGFSSMHRTVIAGLQERQAHTIGGAALMVGLGILVTQLRNVQNGKPLETDPEALLYQGIDRSGITGLLGDVNSTFLRMMGANSPVTGVYAGNQNLAQRSLDLAGPTGSQINRLLSGNAATLVPGHNIPWFAYGFRQLEAAEQ